MSQVFSWFVIESTLILQNTFLSLGQKKNMTRERTPHQSYCSLLIQFIKLSIAQHTMNFSQLWTFKHVISFLFNHWVPTHPSRFSSNVTCSIELFPTSPGKVYSPSTVFPQYFRTSLVKYIFHLKTQ